MFWRKTATQNPSTTVDTTGTRPKRLNKLPVFYPGQMGTITPSGGGGPENTGARPVQSNGGTKAQGQPSWRFEFEDDFIGYAAPSVQPDLSGTPANNFRGLGDNHGGRQ